MMPAISQPFHEGHRAIDIAVPVGTPLRPLAAGVVTAVRPNYGDAGNQLEIDYGGGWLTRYDHLSAFACRVGDHVAYPDVVAYSGGARGAPGAGNSQGPHLHLELWYKGEPVDPAEYIDW
jgi:murein DD-endopeptidase MepM/ murein hydrolase activator NlpD